MAEPVALEMVVGDFGHQLGTERGPTEVLAGTPAALTARHPLVRVAVLLHPRVLGCGPGLEGCELLDELGPLGHAEPGGDAHVVEHALGIEEAQAGANPTPPSLCSRKPPTTQSAVRSCLTFIMTRLPG